MQRAKAVGWLALLIELRVDTPRGKLSFENAGIDQLKRDRLYGGTDSPWTKFVDRTGTRAFYYHGKTKQATLVVPKQEGCWRLDRSFPHFDGWWRVLNPHLHLHLHPRSP